MNTINLHCPISTKTGYGTTSLNIMKALINNQYDIRLFPIGACDVDSNEDRNLVAGCINNGIFNWKKDHPCLKIWHQFDLCNRIGSGKYGALIFFEADKLKPQEINMINNLDVVFVASKWAKTILLQNNINIPIVVSPLAVDTDIFSPIVDPNKSQDKYVFINIGKWEVRKGHDFLVEAFNKAFSSEDNVELWMINHNIFLSKEDNKIWENLYTSSPLGSKIKILPRATTHKDLAAIINLADCGIFPARAEGWNNEILEVMGMDKPIITTNYSAHTEYCTVDNSFLIDIDKLVSAKDDKFFDGYGNWADLGDHQLEQTIELMKKVYSQNIRKNTEGLKTAKNYTWSKTAQILAKELLNADTI